MLLRAEHTILQVSSIVLLQDNMEHHSTLEPAQDLASMALRHNMGNNSTASSSQASMVDLGAMVVRSSQTHTISILHRQAKRQDSSNMDSKVVMGRLRASTDSSQASNRTRHLRSKATTIKTNTDSNKMFMDNSRHTHHQVSTLRTDRISMASNRIHHHRSTTSMDNRRLHSSSNSIKHTLRAISNNSNKAGTAMDSSTLSHPLIPVGDDGSSVWSACLLCGLDFLRLMKVGCLVCIAIALS